MNSREYSSSSIIEHHLHHESDPIFCCHPSCRRKATTWCSNFTVHTCDNCISNYHHCSPDTHIPLPDEYKCDEDVILVRNREVDVNIVNLRITNVIIETESNACNSSSSQSTIYCTLLTS
jgi:hypothetical protein